MRLLVETPLPKWDEQAPPTSGYRHKCCDQEASILIRLAHLQDSAFVRVSEEGLPTRHFISTLDNPVGRVQIRGRRPCGHGSSAIPGEQELGDLLQIRDEW